MVGRWEAVRELARARLPPGLARRLQLAFLAICLLRLTSLTPQLVLAPEEGAVVHGGAVVHAGAVVLAVATGAWWVRCYRRGRFALAGLALEAAALVSIATVLGDPYRVVSTAYLAGMFHALARDRRGSTAYAAVMVVALTGAAVLIPVSGADRTRVEVALAVVGIPVFMVVMHLVAVASAQADAAVVRGRVVAESGLGIARALGEDAARTVSRTTVVTLLGELPGASARLLPAATPPPAEQGETWRDFPVPVTADDQRVIRVVSPVPIPDEVAQALTVVATQLALALAKSALTDDLSRRAAQDPLTGLHNRRSLGEAVRAALDRAALDHAGTLQDGGVAGAGRGEGRQVAVLTLDLDGFKAVNDTHGHAAGDALLVAAARRLSHQVRGGDTVARLGGDEFLVMLDDEGAGTRGPELAHRLLASIAAPFDVGGATVRVGVSVGVAVAEPGESVDAVLMASDGALYRAKREGRGRVVVAGARDPLTPSPSPSPSPSGPSSSSGPPSPERAAVVEQRA